MSGTAIRQQYDRHSVNGWNMLNYLAVAPVLIIVFGLLWLAFQGRQGGTAMPVQS